MIRKFERTTLPVGPAPPTRREQGGKQCQQPDQSIRILDSARR